MALIWFRGIGTHGDEGPDGVAADHLAVVDDGRNTALLAAGFEQTAVIIAAPRAIRGHGPTEGNGMRRRCDFARRFS
ncbi:MAG: hypothetical protein OXG19_08920 [Chloroflexi bacterium]|nr:hypothetical protein [Chloroflexota bacterium]